MKSMWRDDVPVTTNPLVFFLFSSRPHWRAALLAVVLSSFGSAVSAGIAYVFKVIANAAAEIPQTGSYDTLLLWCVAYIGVLAVAKAAWRLAGFAGARWGTGASATARFALTSYVTLHSRAYFANRFAGSIMNKIRHAATGMREVADTFLWEFLELFVQVVVSCVLIFYANATIAFIFIVWVVAIVLVNMYLGKKRVPLAVRAHNYETAVNGATVDLVSNMGAVQEYARRSYEVERVRVASEKRRVAHLKSWYFGEWNRIVNSILLVVFGSMMVFTTVYFAQRGIVSVGDIMLVLAIIFRIEGQLQSLGSNFNKFAETWGEIRESLEEIVITHEIVDMPGATTLSVSKGEIQFDAARFAYTDNDVFPELHLKIAGSERVGLVGRSGAGKSTLIRLLMRHHDMQGGTILIDGQDISKVTQDSLHTAIAVVPQDTLLFHRSIRDNIAYGKPEATEEEIIEAAKRAHAHDFILRLSEGYGSLVGERGVKLSGGERQRIAIARAILKSAPILLLDEATSALDSESEVEIQRALHTLMEGKTVIAIAHRLSTLREMDRIIVLDEGKIVEEGTHDQLVARGGTYAELWQHQAGGFLQDER